MKKIMILAMVAAMMVFAGSAFADETWCGSFCVDEITVYESSCSTDVPVQACDVLINWYFGEDCTGQGPYLIPVTACGTLLNVALLKAWNEDLCIEGCILITFVDPFPTFSAKILNVTFDDKMDCPAGA